MSQTFQLVAPISADWAVDFMARERGLIHAIELKRVSTDPPEFLEVETGIRWRGRRTAQSKANSATRHVPCRVIRRVATTASSVSQDSSPVYMPSVFSRRRRKTIGALKFGRPPSPPLEGPPGRRKRHPKPVHRVHLPCFEKTSHPGRLPNKRVRQRGERFARHVQRVWVISPSLGKNIYNLLVQYVPLALAAMSGYHTQPHLSS